MTTEAKIEITKDASTLAYTHIRLSGLHKEIDNDRWDRLADEWGGYIVNLLEGLTDAEFTRTEAAAVSAGLDLVEHQ